KAPERRLARMLERGRCQGPAWQGSQEIPRRLQEGAGWQGRAREQVVSRLPSFVLPWPLQVGPARLAHLERTTGVDADCGRMIRTLLCRTSAFVSLCWI